jgi:hypothetical protein
MAQVPYRFAHSHRQRRYGLDTLQPAVREIAVFFAGDFREEEFRVTKDSSKGAGKKKRALPFPRRPAVKLEPMTPEDSASSAN